MTELSYKDLLRFRILEYLEFQISKTYHSTDIYFTEMGNYRFPEISKVQRNLLKMIDFSDLLKQHIAAERYPKISYCSPAERRGKDGERTSGEGNYLVERFPSRETILPTGQTTATGIKQLPAESHSSHSNFVTSRKSSRSSSLAKNHVPAKQDRLVKVPREISPLACSGVNPNS